MKISVLSDAHLGFGRGTEREGDAYEALAEALEKSKDCDLVLMAGDMFDSSNPPAETLALAEEVLLPYLLPEGGARISEGIGKDTGALKLVNPRKPVIAIHGTHERRAKGLLNPVQALEKAGFLVHLHCNGVVLEKDGERVCIQGMSGVPDQYAGRVLEEWNPRPKEGCFNILMLHQNLKGFMHEKVLNQLDPELFNKGFSLYVCGHIHDSREAELGGSRLVIPGGMVTTQLREGEIVSRKTRDISASSAVREMQKELGFFSVNTKINKAEFVRLENQRKVYFLEAETRQDAEREIEKLVSGNQNKKPLIRLKVKGDFPARELSAKFSSSAILKVKKESEEALEGAVGLEEQRLSVRELGKKLLRENLQKQGLEPDLFEQVFELLLEKREARALELLRESAGGREAAKAPKQDKKPRRDSGEWQEKGELGRFLG